MSNEELKKKIVEILEETEYEWTEEKNGYILQIFYDKLADALIVAGIGDVKEAEHRAEIAERAFDDLADEIYQHDVRPICDKEFFRKARFEQAQKELAEEGKDD